ARGADDAGQRWWYFLGGVADMRKMEPLARQLRQFVEARIGAAEMEHIDQDAGVRAIDRPHDARRLRQVPRFRPVREFEAHEDAERLREIAQPGKACRRAFPVRIRELRDDMPRAELRRRFELGN